MRSVIRTQMKMIVGCFAVLCIAAISGCGGPADDRPVRNVVSGVVTYQGNPVEDAILVFRPVGSDGQNANGRTDASGEFQMGTFEGTDGVVPGEYSVMISKLEVTETPKALPEDDPNYDPNPKVEAPPKNLLPEKYSKAETSGLTVSVPEGQDVTDLKFELTD